jgi:predicted benzoate:H+ symporter BenE
MIHASIFVLALGGFVLLLLAMARHQQDWLRRKLPAALGRTLRLSGFAALALAFAVSGVGLGWSYGAVVWFGWLTIAAALIVTTNTNRERIMRKLRP